MTMQSYVMFFAGVALLLINFFVKTWVLNIVIMLLMVGVVLSQGINEWWQYGSIVIMIWQFLSATNSFIEEYL